MNAPAPAPPLRLPDWMSDSAPAGTPTFPRESTQLTPEVRQLERQTFAIAFEFLLEHMTTGRSLEEFARTYHTPLVASRFRTWIFRDTRRKEAFYAAKAIGAEAIEEELTRIADGLDADGNPSPDDVARSTLRINVRKWILQVNNRRRYGDVKQIEQTTTTRFDPSTMSTSALQQKLFDALGIGTEDAADILDVTPDADDLDDPA